MERTLVLIKPEGVQRAIVRKVLTRFENAGFKIVYNFSRLSVNNAFFRKIKDCFIVRQIWTVN